MSTTTTFSSIPVARPVSTQDVALARLFALTKPFDENLDPKSNIFNFCTKYKIQAPVVTYQASGPPHIQKFTAFAEVPNGTVAAGPYSTKAKAEAEVYRQIQNNLWEVYGSKIMPDLNKSSSNFQTKISLTPPETRPSITAHALDSPEKLKMIIDNRDFLKKENIELRNENIRLKNDILKMRAYFDVVFRDILEDDEEVKTSDPNVTGQMKFNLSFEMPPFPVSVKDDEKKIQRIRIQQVKAIHNFELWKDKLKLSDKKAAFRYPDPYNPRKELKIFGQMEYKAPDDEKLPHLESDNEEEDDEENSDDEYTPHQNQPIDLDICLAPRYCARENVAALAPQQNKRVFARVSQSADPNDDASFYLSPYNDYIICSEGQTAAQRARSLARISLIDTESWDVTVDQWYLQTMNTPITHTKKEFDKAVPPPVITGQMFKSPIERLEKKIDEKLDNLKVQVTMEPSIEKKMEETKSLLTDLNQTVKQFPTDMRENATKLIQDTMKSLSTMRDQVSSLFSMTALQKGIGMFEDLMHFIATILAMIKAETMQMRILIGTMFITKHHMLSTSVGVLEHLIDFAMTTSAMFDLNPEITGQGKDEGAHQGILKTTITFLHAIFTNGPLDNEVIANGTKLSKVSSGLKGIKDITAYIFEVIVIAFKWLYGFFTGVPWEHRGDKSLCEWYNELIDYVNELENEKDLDNFFRQRDNYLQVIEKKVRMDEIDKIRIGKYHLSPLYLRAKDKFLQYYRKAVLIYKAGAARNEPLCIALYGPAGAGKSTLKDCLAAYYCAACLGKKFETHQIYHRKSENIYWEGYTNQPICVIDDIFQSGNTEEMRLIALELIYMVNVAPYPLHMAAVDTKSDTFFTSSLVIITGNKDLSNTVPILDATAFERRQHIRIQVDLKPGIKLSDHSSFDPSVYKLTDIKTGKVIELNDVFNMIKSKYDTMNVKKTSIQESMTAFSERLLKLGKKTESPIDLLKTQPQEIEVSGQMQEGKIAMELMLKKSVGLKPLPGENYVTSMVTSAGQYAVYISNANYATLFKNYEFDFACMVTVDLNCYYLLVKQIIPQNFHTPTKVDDLAEVFARSVVTDIPPIDEQLPAHINGQMFAPTFAELPKDTSKISQRYIEKVHHISRSSLVDVQKKKEQQALLDKWITQKKKETEKTQCIEKEVWPAQCDFTGKCYDFPTKNSRDNFLNGLAMGKFLTIEEIDEFAASEGATEHKGIDRIEQSDHMKQLITFLVAAIGILTLSGVAISMYVAFNKKDDISGQLKQEYNVNKQAYKRSSAKLATKNLNYKPRIVGQVDQNSMDIVKVVSANTGRLTVTFANGGQFSQGCTFRKGRTFFCAAHFTNLLELPDVLEFSIQTDKGTHVVALKDVRVFDDPDDDRAMVTILDPKFPEFRNIDSYICIADDLGEIASSTIALIDKDMTTKIPILLPGQRVEKIPYFEYPTHSGSKVITHCRDVLRIDGDKLTPKGGDCGQCYVVLSTHAQRKIVGFHVAGGAGVGICALLTQEKLRQFDEHDTPIEGQMRVTVPDLLESEPLVNPMLSPRLPHRTEISESLLYGVYGPPTVGIAKLVPGDGQSPVQNMINKLAKPDTFLSDSDRTLLKACRKEIFRCIPEIVQPQVFSVDQVLSRPPGYRFAKTVDVSSSPGWPYNTPQFKQDYKEYYDLPSSTVFKGKEVFVKMVNDRPVAEEFLYTEVHDFVSDILSCKRDNWEESKALLKERVKLVFTMFPKDELLPLEKVEKYQTRPICGAPFPYVITMRALTLAFVENILEGHNRNEFAAGVNPHSHEWTIMHDYLFKGSSTDDDHAVPGDLKAQDATTCSALTQEVAEGICEWMERFTPESLELVPGYIITRDEINFLRKALFHLTFEQRSLVIFCLLIFFTHGNASGNPLTMIVNCLFTLIALLFCAMLAVHHTNQRRQIEHRINLNIQQVNALIPKKALGDDHVMTVRGELRGVVNMASTHHFMKRLGYEYVDFMKRPITVTENELGIFSCSRDYYNYKEINFLKRKFVRGMGYVSAPLLEEVLKNTVNYCSNFLGLQEATMMSANNVMREWYHWGKDAYYRELNFLNRALAERRLPQMPDEYSMLLCKFLGNASVGATLWNPLVGFDEQFQIVGQMKKEAEQKSEFKTVSGSLSIASKISAALSVVPVVGGVAAIASPLLMGASLIAKGFGYNYPSSLIEPSRMLPVTVPNMAPGRGLDPVPQLGMDPENRIATEDVYTQDRDYQKLDEYKMLPSLVATFHFDSTATLNASVYSMPILPTYMAQNTSNEVFSITPVGNIATKFKYWKGGMKFLLHFFASKFLTARVRIEWHYNPATINTVTNTDIGDILSLTVDIAGDTIVPFMVPYLSDTLWLPVIPPNIAASLTASAQYTIGSFAVIVVNRPIAANTVGATTIDCAVWMSAAEDFTCSRPVDMWDNYEYSPDGTFASKGKTEISGQMAAGHANMRTLFQTQFKPLVAAKMRYQFGDSNAEVISTWPELFHRYTLAYKFSMASTIIDSTQISWYDPQTISTQMNGRSWLVNFLYSFLQHRGGFRARVVQTTAASTSFMTLANKNLNDLAIGEFQSEFPDRAGFVTQRTADVPYVGAEVPYYSIYPFQTFMYQYENYERPAIQLTKLSPSSEASNLLYVFLCPADDYTCGYPIFPGYLWYFGAKKIVGQMESNRGAEERLPTEHMNDQERSGQLTSFRDTVGLRTDEGRPMHSKLFDSTNPYPDAGLNDVLGRTYLPVTITWSGTDAQGSVIGTVNLPHDQFVATNVTDKLDRNAYIRCAFELEIRSNSTSFNSGALMFAYCPHWNPTNPYGVMSVMDMYALSALDVVIFSAQTGESVKFKIPYAAPSPYLKTGNSTASTAPLAGWMGTVKVFVLAPLRQVSSSSVPSVTVQVYCKMIDIDIAGPTISNIVTKVQPPSVDANNNSKVPIFKKKPKT